ncbi:MAG: type III-B CRISPR module-associated Cmr3 family protein [Anaerolineae bacterium]
MMHLFLEPIDVWLFRDGRPFDALSDHRAQSLFPPYPSTVQGAIRSYELVRGGIDLHDRKAIAAAVGTASDYGALRLRGPWVARREGERIVRYLPVPADAWLDSDKGRARPCSPPERPEGLLTSAPTERLLGLRDTPTKAKGEWWLDETSLQRYLDGQEVDLTASGKLYQRESRFGIALQPGRRTVRTGALYEVETVRPQQDVGLSVEVDGYGDWPERGTLRLGGEGHAARFEQVRPAQQIAGLRPLPAEMPARFKLCLLTPAYFRFGWQPEWTQFFDGKVTLVAAAIGRYESVGGHDMTGQGEQAHKAALRYVPAGSVYYLQAEGTVRPKDGAGLALTDRDGQIGYGQVAYGEWQEHTSST